MLCGAERLSRTTAMASSSVRASKKYNGAFCVAPGCSNSAGKDKVQGVQRPYFKFPLQDKKRLKLWMRSIPRDKWVPSIHSRICGDHFVGGIKTKDPNSPGYVPSVFKVVQKQTAERSTKRAVAAGKLCMKSPVKKKRARLSAVSDVSGRPARIKPSDDNVPYSNPVWASDHDYVKTVSVSGPMTEAEALRQQCKQQQDQISILHKKSLSLGSMESHDFPLWTGLANQAVFECLASYLQSRGIDKVRVWRGQKSTPRTSAGTTGKRGPDRLLTFKEELFLVLVKLKTGFSNLELERLFQVSDTYISQIFTTHVNVLAVELKHMFQVPNVQPDEGIPGCFKDYPDLHVVLDCTELWVEQAGNLQARKELYSNYKGRETVKFLVGLSPYQTVNYVSCAWGGRASDKQITLSSQDLLQSLPGGASVMTDRGFNISDDLKKLGVELIIPSFKGRGRPQLSQQELRHSERVAEARIHVERIIQRIRTFHILDSRAKLSMQDITEQIFVCCAYLVNFSFPIVKV